MNDLFSVAGRRALVTGGTRGIGAMIAEGLVRAGASVLVCSRGREEGAATTRRLSQWGSCESLAVDVTTIDGRRELCETTSDRFGHLDILVNNAGTTWYAPFEAFPDDGLDRVWSLNVKAAFQLTRELLPLLMLKASSHDPSRVINISSVHGIRPPARGVNNFSYSMSKAAMNMMTQHLALELAPRHITVNALAPGPFPSKLTSPLLDDEAGLASVLAAVPLGRVGAMEDVAGAALFLSSPAGSYLTGVVLPVDGGLCARD